MLCTPKYQRKNTGEKWAEPRWLLVILGGGGKLHVLPEYDDVPKYTIWMVCSQERR